MFLRVITNTLYSSRLSLAGGSADISRDDLLSKLIKPGRTEEEEKAPKKLSSQIRLNEAFSGVKFESTEWEIINKGVKKNN